MATESLDRPELQLRAAVSADLKALQAIEQQCFQSDRLSSRSFRQFIQSEHNDLWVAEDAAGVLLGYGLTLRHRGTRMARLYSLAISPDARGRGVAQALLAQLESLAAAQGRLLMRLEVAKSNTGAIALYQKLGYRVFGEYADYYQDHTDALRMQKRIRRVSGGVTRSIPWYAQTTEFTCGPSALMMAMASLKADYHCTQAEELAIWREATTVFMTSGHGGCHPLGLALAAKRRGFDAEVWVNSDQPLFLEGVRAPQKKQIMTLVHQQFVEACAQASITTHYAEADLAQLTQWLEQGAAVLVLISTYQLDGRKAPHWVTLTGIDDQCLYLHDPDLDEDQQQLAIDCQHLPLAREDFSRISSYGRSRLRTLVVIR